MVFERFVYNCKAVRRTLAGLRHNDNHAVRERTVPGGPVLLGAGSPVATRIAWRNSLGGCHNKKNAFYLRKTLLSPPVCRPPWRSV